MIAVGSAPNPTADEAAQQLFEFHRRHSRGAFAFGCYGLALLAALTYCSIIALPSALQSTRPSGPIFTEPQLLSLLAEDSNASESAARIDTGLRVVLVLVDGLRLDAATQWEGPMLELLNRSEFSRDMAVLESRAALPSYSFPNYVTAFSGSPPEITGVTGNDNVEQALLRGESARLGIVDSVLFKARKHGLRKFITGSSENSAGVMQWWRLALDHGTPTAQHGGGNEEGGDTDALVPITVDGSGYAEADRRAAAALLDAMAVKSPRPYDFLFASFLECDHQAHAHGGSSNEYKQAAAERAADLRRILAAADSNTVVVIFADHGHADVGGHGGGTEEVVLRIPLAIYRNASGLRAGSAGKRNTGSALNLAATVNSIMGMPPPFLSQGDIWDAAACLLPANATRRTYQRLFRQRQRYAAHFVNAVGWKGPAKDRETLAMADAPGDGQSAMTDAQAVEWYRSAAASVHAVAAKARANAIARRRVANSLIGGSVAIVLSLVAFVLCAFGTVCDLFIPCRRFNVPRKHGLWNAAGMAVSVGMWAVYFAVVVGVAVIIERFGISDWSGWHWTITMINKSSSLATHFGPTLAVGFVVAAAIHVSILVGLKKVPELRYLCEHYALLVQCLATIALWFSFSFSFVFFPRTLQCPFVTAATWDGQFRLMYVAILTIPMSLIGAFVIILWQHDLASVAMMRAMFKQRTSLINSRTPLVSLMTRKRPPKPQPKPSNMPGIGPDDDTSL